MRKRTWLEIGIVALGLFLVCASREAAESRAARTGGDPAGFGAPVAPVPGNPVTEPIIPPAQPARPEGQGRR